MTRQDCVEETLRKVLHRMQRMEKTILLKCKTFADYRKEEDPFESEREDLKELNALLKEMRSEHE